MRTRGRRELLPGPASFVIEQAMGVPKGRLAARRVAERFIRR